MSKALLDVGFLHQAVPFISVSIATKPLKAVIISMFRFRNTYFSWLIKLPSFTSRRSEARLLNIFAIFSYALLCDNLGTLFQ